MPLIVDTYNVLHVTGVLPPELAGLNTQRLADLIRSSRYRRRRVMLVCDGRSTQNAPQGLRGRIEVRYSGVNQTADDVIARIVEQSTAPKRLLVVSSDAAVCRSARVRRCRTISSEQFLRRLWRDSQKPTAENVSRPLSATGRKRIAEWTKVFDLREDESFEVEIPESLLDQNEVSNEAKKKTTDQDSGINEKLKRRTVVGGGDASPQQRIRTTDGVLPDELLREAEAMLEEDRNVGD